MSSQTKPDSEDPQEMNRRLRLAYHSVAAPPGLETRIRAAVRGDAPRALPWWRGYPMWAALAVMLVTGAGITLFVRIAEHQELANLSSRLAAVLRPGLQDHVHCAIHRGLPKTPQPLEESIRELGPEYKDLIEVVRRTAPKGFVLSTGHLCKTEGRQFAHLAMTNGRQVLSLVIAAKEDGETFLRAPIRPARSVSGTSFYEATAQQYAVSAFETERHLVYTVSDLPADDNMSVMIALAPGVQDVLRPAL